ncbi:hypothetical protein TNCV_445311 [Trichonephila clavipes]|nr:hypothetical protein TNCV_445311 [Trichonephila clavipes]
MLRSSATQNCVLCGRIHHIRFPVLRRWISALLVEWLRQQTKNTAFGGGANPQVESRETPLHPEKLTVWCTFYGLRITLVAYFFKNDEGHNAKQSRRLYRAMINNSFFDFEFEQITMSRSCGEQKRRNMSHSSCQQLIWMKDCRLVTAYLRLDPGIGLHIFRDFNTARVYFCGPCKAFIILCG